ncbi:hypothetical protein [Paludisphaera soli]|uniref:hypothetical protein n=1 Tax=Paludisphaera soli TaxID=2712865 RepID=UPI0013ED363E|nr:hypothetical protein [Paludisphaera soli]
MRRTTCLMGIFIVAATSAATARAEFMVRDVRSTGSIASLDEADALLGGAGVLREATATRAFLDLFDAAADTGEGRGRFGNDLSFPGDVAGVAGRESRSARRPRSSSARPGHTRSASIRTTACG